MAWFLPRYASRRRPGSEADGAGQELKPEEDEERRQVEHPEGRDDPTHGTEDGLGELMEDRGDRRHGAPRRHGEERQDDPTEEDEEVELEEGADNGHGELRKRPRAWRRSFSSAETSTLVGVR